MSDHYCCKGCGQRYDKCDCRNTRAAPKAGPMPAGLTPAEMAAWRFPENPMDSRSYPSAPKAEPDGWKWERSFWEKYDSIPAEIRNEATPLYAAPPAPSVAEPVAWVIPGDDNARQDGWLDAKCFKDGEFSLPLYRLDDQP